MSVLKSKRKISSLEFENTFAELYKFSLAHTSKVPKRRKKWLCFDIDNSMNTLYRGIMHINDIYIRDRQRRLDYTSDAAVQHIVALNELEKPLMVLWNVQEFETSVMISWVSKIKQEVFLLNRMNDKGNIACSVSILDWRAINAANFLKNMSELHRYTHGKVAHAQMRYDDTEGSVLISLVNDAFYELILANKKIPETKKEYVERKQHISNAITYLKEMNRPLLFYFNLMEYSERIMNEWSKLLADEIKLLTALQKSDKLRFHFLIK